MGYNKNKQSRQYESFEGICSRKKERTNNAGITPITFLKKFKPRNEKQQQVIQTIRDHDLTFLIGVAGTAKTFLGVRALMEMFQEETLQRIVAVRPAVEAGDSIGFLTGDLVSKMSPYLRPVLDSVDRCIDIQERQTMMQQELLELTSITYARGRTFEYTGVLADEMQNATREQLKTILTRQGEGGKTVVTMDPSQCDLHDFDLSCIHDLWRFENKEGIAIIRFNNDDVVRSKIVKTILQCYDVEHIDIH